MIYVWAVVKTMLAIARLLVATQARIAPVKMHHEEPHL